MNKTQSKHYWAVVPAAGVGTRMGSQTPKQYLTLLDKPIIQHTLERLLAHEKISGVIVALGKADEYWDEISFKTDKPIIRVNGGTERCHSVLNALYELLKLPANGYDVNTDDWVLVHDAARPCLRKDDIDTLIAEVEQSESGGILALPVRDTMKRQAGDGTITETVDRKGLWHALTPQMFPLDKLRHAIEQSLNDGFLITDEASALEHSGEMPLLVHGHEDNIKITRPADLKLAEMYLKAQLEEQADS